MKTWDNFFGALIGVGFWVVLAGLFFAPVINYNIDKHQYVSACVAECRTGSACVMRWIEIHKISEVQRLRLND